ncbi:MAG: PLP-dependent transferase [Lachnospiraceae bacterium]|nr:PLP-dependent transferase [Lachnospiraceae bacterium]
MIGEFDNSFDFATNILEAGAYFREPATNPEALPIHLSTAHNVNDLDDLQKRYDESGFCYNRYRNPNRTALNDLMTYIENGKASGSYNSGMAAICAAIISNTKAGDHVVSGDTLYGESLEIFTKIVGKYGVETTFVDICDLDAVKAAMRPNTVMIYGETVANPVIAVPDIKALSEIAHANNALLIIDNTFMTGALFRPLDFGADIVVSSLTKFANGHSDSTAGALTSNDPELVKKAFDMQQLMGNQASPFDSWLTSRGIRTLDLRVKKQSDNACALAKMFAESPYVEAVYHPSLESNPYHEIATKQFGKYYGPMLSVVLPEDREKMNKFMRSMKLCHYAMTLGGYRTTMSYPPMSSHSDLTREERYAMGITDGLLRFSCGIEDTDDLVADMKRALEEAYGA